MADEIELVDSSFRLHQFTVTLFATNVNCQVLKMKDSLFVWIGDEENAVLSDLSFGIQSAYEPHPISTKILGTASTDTTSMSMAERLTKKLKKPVYVSFNVPLSNNNILEEFEKRLNEEIAMNPDVFWLLF